MHAARGAAQPDGADAAEAVHPALARVFKKLDNLKAAVAMFMAYYNFVWGTRYPDASGRRGQLWLPAAMLVGVVDALWDFERLFHKASAYCPQK